MINWGEGDVLAAGTAGTDSREALSRRHGNAPVLVLPLASGRLAVLGLERRLLGFCDSLAEACEMSAAHWAEVEAQWSSRKLVTGSAAGTLVTSKSVDDLF